MSQEITTKSSAEKETTVQEPTRDEELATPCEEEHPKTLEELSAKEEDNAGKFYPPARKVVVVMIALYLSLFLVSLDRTIVSTAVPQITNAFHSINDIGWYASAYLITGCAFQLLYGRLFTFFAPNWGFLASVTVFELGSLVCRVSRNSSTIIVDRAIAGLGSAGIMSGTIVLTVHTIPLQKRPLYQSFMGIVFMISSVTGPIIGGAFTTHLTWRWCFYLNLPIGGATLLLAFWLLPSDNNKTKEEFEATKHSTREKIERLDPISTLCFLPGIVCLLLALQLGGSTYAWNNWRIILLWIMFGILIIMFAAVQMWKQESATIPPHILRYRSVTASTFFAFCISGKMTVGVYFLPLWFQAIEGVDAIESGIRILPLILALLFSSIIT